MHAEDFALAQGIRDTRVTLAGWNERPFAVLRPWLLASLTVVTGLLLAVWALASISAPDPTPFGLPGLTRRGTWGDVGSVLFRNSLVLALHAMACVAGFHRR